MQSLSPAYIKTPARAILPQNGAQEGKQVTTKDFREKAAALDGLLGVGQCFDMTARDLTIGGRAARLWVVNGYAQEDILNSLKSFFNNAKDLTAVIRKTIEENEGLKKEVEGYVKEHMLQLRDRLVAQAEETNGVHLIKAVIPTALAPDVAKDLAFQIAGILPNKTLCVLGTTHETKPLLTVMLSKDLVQEQQLNAGALVREAAKLIKGGGGGAPHFATAGGKDANGLEAAVHKVIELAGL